MLRLTLRRGLLVAANVALRVAGRCQTNVRIATYSIQFLNKDISAGRKADIQSVLADLNTACFRLPSPIPRCAAPPRVAAPPGSTVAAHEKAAEPSAPQMRPDVQHTG